MFSIKNINEPKGHYFRMWELLGQLGVFLLEWCLRSLTTQLASAGPLENTTTLVTIATNIMTMYSGMSQLVGRLKRLHYLLCSGTLLKHISNITETGLHGSSQESLLNYLVLSTRDHVYLPPLTYETYDDVKPVSLRLGQLQTGRFLFTVRTATICNPTPSGNTTK